MKSERRSTVQIPYSEMDDYETKYNLKEKHDKLLELLVSFDHFCREYGIKYSLCDGTLLGAVRHADFIPWDDDADVMMTRNEYEKLRKVVKDDKRIRLLKICFLDRFSTNCMLEQGVYIDVFINDNYEGRIDFLKKKYITLFLRCCFLNVYKSFDEPRSKVKKIVDPILMRLAISLVGKRDVFELNDRIVSKQTGEKVEWYTRYTSSKQETKKRFNKTSYDYGYTDVLFRGKTLMAISHSDTYLKEMYGSDYFTLPPEDKRKPEHEKNMLYAPIDCIKFLN